MKVFWVTVSCALSLRLEKLDHSQNCRLSRRKGRNVVDLMMSRMGLKWKWDLALDDTDLASTEADAQTKGTS